ncbi:uncharacterized protein LOC144431195 [Styela clava]
MQNLLGPTLQLSHHRSKNFKSKNDGSDIVRLIKKSRDEKEKAENKCDVIYKKTCYRVVVYDVKNVTFNEAEPICKSKKNGKLANIYDLAHYQSLLSYIRSIVPSGKTDTSLWTGMEYKKRLLLSDGRPITIATEVWFPLYPSWDASWTIVAVVVNKEPKNKYQGIFNDESSSQHYGVICEI